ncbi:MAG: CstA-like transporter-associated (seleno)protein [Chromatiales bacterium]
MTETSSPGNPPIPPVSKEGGERFCGLARGPAALSNLVRALGRWWCALRRATGDDAYERYLAHWDQHHVREGGPLTPSAFFRAEQQRKWDGIGRCC